eukprot:TRINITY_DN913_c0_g1_i1.p1 TRINITY_DN913_c0_g1~~TRINITY_DN913_c0_g1_i1.p1  ORF type:complete len:141 (-),score=31.04 TRINITY_DN913_c0_g1_i1:141-563(-)
MATPPPTSAKGLHVFLKKEFKMKNGSVANKKSLTLTAHHNIKNIVAAVNGEIAQYQLKGKPVKGLQFNAFGSHYILEMNHDIQKFLEEDIILCCMDRLSTSGYRFLCQVDSSINSQRMTGASITQREVWTYINLPPLENK